MGHAKPKRIGLQSRAPRRRSKAGLVSTTGIRGGWGIRYRIAIDVPTFDPVALVDHISDVVMAEHWHAIGDGRRADGSGEQPPLNPRGVSGRRAEEGQRPDVRGYTGLSTTPFRDNIERSAIRVRGRAVRRSRITQGVRALAGQVFEVLDEAEGTRASARIVPDRVHRGWLKFEARRGIAYFFVSDYMGRLVDEAVEAFFGVAMKGLLLKGSKREAKAAKARTK